MLLVAAAAGCGSKRTPEPTPKEACAAVFDRFRAAVAPALVQLGIASSPAGEAGLATCERWPEATRRCLLHAVVGPDAWTACKAESPFVFFDGAALEANLLGAELPPAESRKRVAALAGRWHHDPIAGGDGIDWTVADDGALAAHRTQTPAGKPAVAFDEPPHELSFPRERQIAIATGPSAQLVPAYVDGDHLFLGWSAHALAMPIANDRSFALYLGEGSRWLVWSDPTCTLLEPRIGAMPATCGWKDGAFTFRDERGRDQVWTRHGGALVNPAMDELVRQGK